VCDFEGLCEDEEAKEDHQHARDCIEHRSFLAKSAIH
jgi:hypothetical protein